MPAEKPHAAPTVFRVQRASTVDLIATELRNAIFSGALQVGRPLGEIDIAAQLGVSRSPLREATQRLVQEGLLTATPGRGLSVSAVGPDRVQDLYDARLAIESQAARLVIRGGTTAALATIETAFERLVEASEGTSARIIGDADLDFHWALVQASGNTRLLRYMSTLIVETRMASYSRSEGYVVRRDISQSHANIEEAVRNRDNAAAFSALETHMNDAVARLTGKLDDGGASVETVEQPHEERVTGLEPIAGST